MNKQRKGWNEFVETCHTASDLKTLDSLFDFFLTPEEKNDLALRYLIVKELLRGKKTQRQIAQALNVSIAKITRGSNELKRCHFSLTTFLQKKTHPDEK